MINQEIGTMNVPKHCNYFVKRKKRYCRMTVKKGEQYCGEHNQEASKSDENAKDTNKRMKCPLDSSHTCYVSKLSKHLKVCNAKKLIDGQPGFVVKGINLEECSEVPEHVPLFQISNDIVNTVINKINAAYEKLPNFSQEILQHQVLKSKLEDPLCGKVVKKHLLQNASLLAHLEHANLIQEDTCYVEFGAGKAKLTYWLAQIIKEKEGSCIVLVDRSSHRHKSDNKLKNEGCSISVTRIRSDIADLQLDDIPEVKGAKHKVGIAKHLCGAATDLAIRCLVQPLRNNATSNNRGLVIAFCCHHKCDYVSYVGKQYIMDAGFVSDEFPILCSITSWATCGSGLNRRAKELNQDYDENEAKIIGYKAKCLLNWGRLEFLKSIGFQGKLFYYTSVDVSLENMCIVAFKGFS